MKNMCPNVVNPNFGQLDLKTKLIPPEELHAHILHVCKAFEVSVVASLSAEV